MDAQTLLNLISSGKLNLRPDELRALMAQSADMASGQKTLAANTGVFGPTHPFDVCTREQFGYGIWTNTNSKFFNWMQPSMIPDQNVLKIPVMDWRNQLEVTPTTSGTWCDVPSFTPAVIKGCSLDYCFDNERFYHTGRQTITPNDLLKVCFQTPIFNLLGQRITNQDDYERFMMFERQRTTLNRSIILDDAYTASQEDGIFNFFDNFADRHPELTGTCETELSPVDVDLTGVACADILNSVYNRVWGIEQKVSFLTGAPVIPANYWVLLMNPLDAECLLRCQSCINVCNSPIVISPELMTPAGRAVFYNDYNNRLHGGAFGDGFFELRDGRQISIIRDWNVTRGTFFLLVKGWEGNPNGLNLALNNWSEWLRYKRVGAGTVINSLAGGSLLHIVSPDGICDVDHLRWMFRIWSNAPWLQTRFTNVVACSEVVDPNWATLPNLVHDTNCDPVAGRGG